MTSGSASRRLEDLSGLLPLVAGVRTREDVNRILPAVAGSAAMATGFATTVVLLRSPVDGELRLAAGHGDPSAVDALAAAAPLVLDRPAMVRVDATCEVLDEPESAWVAVRDAQGELGGLMGVSGPPGGSMGDVDLRELAAVGAYGGLALRRARVALAAERQRRALEHLMAIGIPAGDDGLGAALRGVVEGVATALEVRSVWIGLTDGAGATLSRREGAGAALLEDRVAVARVEALLAAGADTEGCHLMDRLELQGAPAGTRPGQSRAAIVPLRAPGEPLLGALAVGDAFTVRWPEANELALLRLFADRCAAAVAAVRAHEEAERAAGTDPLTGIGNRHAFIRDAEALLEGPRTADVAILLCDMDDLKAVNDRDGHAAGDARLRELADVLRAACADGEAAYRLGGDEFALIVPRGGELRARGMVAGLEPALERAGTNASVGWAVALAGEPATVDVLTDRADAVMYRVKRDRGTAARPLSRRARRPA
jgi:diguanylate cyclase (GGDEF)-like protein